MNMFSTVFLMLILISGQTDAKKVSSKFFIKRPLNEGYQDNTVVETTASGLTACTAICSALPGCKAFLIEDKGETEIKKCILKNQTHSNAREPSPPADAKFLSYVRLPYFEYSPDVSTMPAHYVKELGKFVAVKKQPMARLDFAGVEKACNSEDAIPFSIYSDEQIDWYLKQMAKEVGNFKDVVMWIGLTDRVEDGTWLLTNGTNLKDLPESVPWAEIQTQEPNGALLQNCAGNEGDSMVDIECIQTRYSVCQYIKDDGNAPGDYEKDGDHYLLYIKDPKIYDDAKKLCESKDGVLAMPFIENGKEKILEFAKIKSGNAFVLIWYGLDDLENDGHWILSNGTKIVDRFPKSLKWKSYDRASKEPNGMSIQNCVLATQDGLEDVACTDVGSTYFACEYYGKSVARGKPTFGEKAFCPTCETGRAVDGNYDAGYGGTTGATVLNGDMNTKAWLIIDMVDTYFIWTMKLIHNSMNPSHETLKDFSVRIGYFKDTFRDNALCHHFKGTFPIYSTYMLPCSNPPVEGRYIALYVDSTTGFILITELEVYGYKEPEGFYD